MKRMTMNRRSFVAGTASLTGLTLAGCAANTPDTALRLPAADSSFALTYGPLANERFPVPAVDPEKLAPAFRRQRVSYETSEPIGTLIVDAPNFYLYHIEENGMAMRYGVGLGRAGFEWSGRARVAWKRPWPTWTPPAEMIAREPKLAKYSEKNGGMPPGLGNPLGARALYIFDGDVDTLYRLHGTANPASIGKAVSSGCVRLVNQDVIHLYDRVKNNSPILVKLA